MDEQHDSAAEHQARQDKAAKKVSDQEAVVRKMNGSAIAHPEEQQLLNETRLNKATIDLNRAMFDYDQEQKAEKAEEKP